MIEFNISGTTPHTIDVTEILPFITDSVHIDGTSEPDFSGTPVVALDGSALAGSAQGLLLTSGAAGSTVEGLSVHSFPGNGITLSGTATGSTIQANHLGTDPAGTTDLGNGDAGLGAFTTGNQIGGEGAGEGNVISGNGGDGIASSGGNTIEGNRIGTDVTGSLDLGNGGSGIDSIGDSEVIGGGGAAGNVIAGNGDNGIQLGGNDHIVEGNAIGTDAGGATALGNDANGIRLNANVSGIRIGGDAPGSGNVIAFNGEDGISTLSNTGTENPFLGNAIYESGQLGIDLGNDGPTQNDPGDTDAGANDLQNFPVITGVTPGSPTTVNGTIDTDAPDTFFRLEFFVQDAADPSQFGEGEVPIGSGEVETDGSGDATFSVGGLGATSEAQTVTATATELTASGGTPLSTSELSEAFHLCTVTGTAGDDAPGAFAVTAGDDVVCALDGDDEIPGSPGDDLIIGGEGDDQIRYSGAGIALTIDLAAGTTSGGQKNDTLLQIEDATGGSRNDTISGVPGEDNDLAGGGGNADLVSYAGSFSIGVDVSLQTGMTSEDGQGGQDTLADFEHILGSARPDTLAGEAGVENLLDGGEGTGPADVVSYENAPAGVVVDLAQQATTEDGGGAADDLVNIGSVTGSQHADDLTGDGADNVLNALNGDDLMVGGGGNDNLAGGNHVDTADFTENTNGITADLPAMTVEGGSTDTLFAVEVFVGTPFDDAFVDAPGVDNTFEGGAGTDRISYAAAPAGITLDLGAGQVSDAGGGTDSFASIEDATGSGFADAMTGDGGPNVLEGGDGDDDLRGEAGIDTLDGGPGDDFANGGNDNDTVRGGEGNDTVLGEGGNDIVLGENGDDVVSGGDGNDTTDAGEGADAVLGEGGDDVLVGLGGNDTLTGGEGNDTASGGGGKDTAVGQGGKDILKGQGGKDTLKGGGGKDTLKGGGGKDKCVGGGGKDKESSCE